MFSGASTSSKKKFVKRKPFCPFCDGEHWPNECTSAKAVEQRFEAAKTKKLCFNCLRKCHPSGTECPSSSRCRECHRPHHTSLHNPDSTRITGATILSWSLPTSVALTTTDAEKHKPFVFLETAIATAQSQFFKRSSNILVDMGAQQTFITLDLVKQLKLQPIWRKKV
jgi:hypothetical protein